MHNNTPSKEDFELAQIFLDHSLRLKAGENVLISVSEHISNTLIQAVYLEAIKRGANPLIESITNFYINRASYSGLNHSLLTQGSDKQAAHIPLDVIDSLANWADAYVRITSNFNKTEFADVAQQRITKRMNQIRPIFDKIIDSDRWILTSYPTEDMAKHAGVSFEWLKEFFYQACIVDYKAMGVQLKKLEKLMDKGSIVKLVGKNTDLTIGIEGRLAKLCNGQRNIPDGEVFLAPNKNTLEGPIYFDMPTIYSGKEMQGIYLEFSKGKVIKAQADKGQKHLDDILATDAGSRFVGEFAFGANYNITKALKDTLFDEKIGGTIHMALGRSYVEKRGGAPVNGNKSLIHWDIVKDMRLKGSTAYIDDKVVLKDGKLLV